jgi:signal transduction histidine kinase
VANDGPRVPREHQERIFEPFARLDGARDAGAGGAGLGLAIARGLVEAHGGHIWIEQPPGGRVSFDLPR